MPRTKSIHAPSDCRGKTECGKAIYRSLDGLESAQLTVSCVPLEVTCELCLRRQGVRLVRSAQRKAGPGRPKRPKDEERIVLVWQPFNH